MFRYLKKSKHSCLRSKCFVEGISSITALFTAFQFTGCYRSIFLTSSFEHGTCVESPNNKFPSSPVCCARRLCQNGSFCFSTATKLTAFTQRTILDSFDHGSGHHNFSCFWAPLAAPFIHSQFDFGKEQAPRGRLHLELTSGNTSHASFGLQSLTSFNLEKASANWLTSPVDYAVKHQAGGLQASEMSTNTPGGVPVGEGKDEAHFPRVEMHAATGTSLELRDDLTSAKMAAEHPKYSGQACTSAYDSVPVQKRTALSCAVSDTVPAESVSLPPEMGIVAAEPPDLQIELAAAIAKLSVPEEPGPEDCCQSGCVRCVWDVYDEQLEKYEEKKSQMEVKILGKKEP